MAVSLLKILRTAQLMNCKFVVPVEQAWQATGVQAAEYQAQKWVSPHLALKTSWKVLIHANSLLSTEAVVI